MTTDATEDVTYRGRDGCELHATIVQDDRERFSASPRSIVVLLHGGGPDHHSLVPLARQLLAGRTVVLPDIRGYGRSICAEPQRHTWAQYAEDIIALLDHLNIKRAVVGGAGLGGTIALRAALAFPARVEGLVLISVEDIEDDQAKAAEIAFMEAFADRVRNAGLEAAWAPILKDLPPIIGAMVREAIPRSDALSIAAAAAIGYDRSFRSVHELAGINVPALIIPGVDWRHPRALAEQLARVMPLAQLAAVEMSADLKTTDDFARTFGPPIRSFLASHFEPDQAAAKASF
jgi:3-oxoadipate enol-lactonase